MTMYGNYTTAKQVEWGGFSIESMPDLWDVGHSPAQIPSYLQLVSSIVKKAMLVSVVVVAPNSMNRQW